MSNRPDAFIFLHELGGLLTAAFLLSDRPCSKLVEAVGLHRHHYRRTARLEGGWH